MNNISLKNKMILSYGALIIFAVLSAGIFSYTNVEKYIYNQATVSYGQTLDQVEMNIEDKLSTYYELMNQIANNKEIVLALSHDYKSPADFSYEFLNTISQAYEIKEIDTTNNILDIFIFKNNDSLPEAGGKLLNVQHAVDTWWYKQYFAKTDQFSVNDYIQFSKLKIWFVTNEDIKPKYSAVNEDSVLETRIAIVKPMILNFEKIVGILEMYIRYETVFGEYMSNDPNNGDHFFVADERDEVIFNSFESSPGTNRKLDQAYLDKMEGKESGNFVVTKNDTKNLVFFKKGKSSNWIYFREMPLENLLSSANTVKRFTIFIVIISIVISILIAISIGSRLSRRISILSSNMEQVDDLSLDMHVAIDGRDEIGKLAKNYNRMIRKIRELIEQLTASQIIQKEAEMKALQAQINPHFLYNTLATINWMVLEDEKEKIISMVDNLSIFYRLSLNKGREYLTIGEEVQQIQAYMNIQKIRLEEKIEVIYDIEHDILDAYTPKLILQPFVENSILHGPKTKKSTTTITIRGYREQNRIILEVQDDGIGMKEVLLPGQYMTRGGYGIRNVHEKIQLRYGNDFGVEMTSVPDQGTLVRIVIPAEVMPPPNA
ncbi:sensor histidine kinase [Paenibacillus sp. PAMC21692]|uniref:sensor histidine kinase n=1 Tax=Paenibacillus sp. PAMC21692 TaxID=2762320 RepID=UPI00164E29E3|nr:sensor histidine kinase [Paenibacillus sp. PAMC21692]QNK57240.1 sensor histidine kinase [Paenibacillus sp. PAMC21692]